jgi:hypothetical protein
MPLVIPRSAPPQYVHSEEILAETLGHSDFDREPWAIGDRVIFEDGTEARIMLEPGEEFHVWSDQVPADLAEIRTLLGMEQAEDWAQLFAAFEPRPKSSGCAASLMLIAVGGTALSYAVLQAGLRG